MDCYSLLCHFGIANILNEDRMKVTPATVEKMIFIVRGHKVMLDSDLATLYEVETGALNRQVKRNIERFPKDFMFQLTKGEYDTLKCQIGISNGRGGRRTPPFAFTENGVAMLSSVLTSKKAIQVNIAIMRIFSKIRNILASDETLAERLATLEKGTNQLFRIVFQRLDKLEAETPLLPKERRKIGLKRKK